MTDVSQFNTFEELPSEAKSLFEAAGAECFFNSLAWFEVFVKNALDEHDRVRILCSPSPSTSDATPRAILAAVERAADSGLLKPRKLSSLSNYYSSLYSLILHSANCWEVTREFAKALATDSPPWDVIELKPLDVNSPAFVALEEALKTAGFVVQTYFCFGNWYLEVQGRSFQQYFEGLPSVLKNTVNRKKKRLEKSGRARLAIYSGGDQLEAAIDAYNSVYAASWKKPEPYPHFVPELMRKCAALGSLRLGTVHVDGKPAAAQFWIVQNGFALIYKLAYDELFRDLSVGSILTASMLEHVIDKDRVREVDYLTGDDDYKKDWMSGRRERWGILAMNPRTLRGIASIARHVGGRAAKRTMQSIGQRFLGALRISQAL
jgi:GNAT acetyltransferase-like protein